MEHYVIAKYENINYVACFLPHNTLTPYVGAYNYDFKTHAWQQGHYFATLLELAEYITEKGGIESKCLYMPSSAIYLHTLDDVNYYLDGLESGNELTPVINENHISPEQIANYIYDECEFIYSDFYESVCTQVDYFIETERNRKLWTKQ